MARNTPQGHFRALQRGRDARRASEMRFGVFGIRPDGMPYKRPDREFRTEAEANEQQARSTALNPGKAYMVKPL